MLKNERKKIGLSQRQFAKKLNVTQSYISRLENNKIDNISVNLILDISKELKLCPVTVFIFFVNCYQDCHFDCRYNCKK